MTVTKKVIKFVLPKGVPIANLACRCTLAHGAGLTVDSLPKKRTDTSTAEIIIARPHGKNQPNRKELIIVHKMRIGEGRGRSRSIFNESEAIDYQSTNVTLLEYSKV